MSSSADHFIRRMRSALVSLEHASLQLPLPSRYSVLLGSALDITRSNAELVAENALHRRVRKPRFTPTNRLWLVLLARRVRSWKEAHLILKPDTLLRLHRQGFRLFWKFKSRYRSGRPTVAPETIALIQQMARENSLWGVERIRGELMKLGIRVAQTTTQKYARLARPPPCPVSG